MLRVNTMICIESILANYQPETMSHDIDDDSARSFVDIIEHGISLDCVLEIMLGVSSTNGNSSIDESKRALAVKKLIRNKIVRESALFCALLGVKQIMLAEFNDVKFDNLAYAGLWLELHGYSKLSRHQYTDCVQAWIRKETVAKVQKLPSGKFLVQEFKIV